MCTVSFLVETTQHADDIFEKKKLLYLTQNVSNFLVIFFDDLPLLVLNLLATLCADGEPTTISIVKATFSIFAVTCRIFLMCLNYWVFDAKKSRFNYFIDALSTFGLFIILVISIAIQ